MWAGGRQGLSRNPVNELSAPVGSTGLAPAEPSVARGDEVFQSRDGRDIDDAVAAFQRHFRPQRVDGIVDVSTLATLKALIATYDARLAAPPTS